MKDNIRKFENSFLLYNNPLDWNKDIPDSIFLQIIKPYQNITRLLGKEFSDKLGDMGYKAFNLQRIGMIDLILGKFENIKGFSTILKNIRNLSKVMNETDISSERFKEYFNQLLRYFSELQVPKALTELNTAIIEFQPNSIGQGEKSCDNICIVNSEKIGMEITTINTQNESTLEIKILDIFQEKAQKQLSQNMPGLLVMDITASGIQYFDKLNEQFYVEFPILDKTIKCVESELEKKENNCLIGVLIVANLIAIKDNLPAFSCIILSKKNKNNEKNQLIDVIMKEKS